MRPYIEMFNLVGNDVRVTLRTNNEIYINYQEGGKNIATILLSRKQWEEIQEKTNNMLKLMDEIESLYKNKN